jgi:RimJ/RimL family protein N-acetyltransferase
VTAAVAANLAVGLVCVVAILRSARIMRRRSAFTRLMQRVPALTVGDFVVRPAEASDVEALIETMDHEFIEANGWTHKLAAKVAARLRTTAPASLGYIAVADRYGTMIGYGTPSGVTPDLSRCSLGFSMHPDFRSRGLGPGALAAVLEAVHRAGVHTVMIGTRESNAAMVSCIAKAGGTEVRRKPTRLPDGSRPMGIWFEHSTHR